jgi:hypothetical protein
MVLKEFHMYIVTWVERDSELKHEVFSEDPEDYLEGDPLTICLNSLLLTLQQSKVYRYRDNNNDTNYNGQVDCKVFDSTGLICIVEFMGGVSYSTDYYGRVLPTYRITGEAFADMLSSLYGEWFNGRKSEIDSYLSVKESREATKRRERDLEILAELEAKYRT